MHQVRRAALLGSSSGEGVGGGDEITGIFWGGGGILLIPAAPRRIKFRNPAGAPRKACNYVLQATTPVIIIILVTSIHVLDKQRPVAPLPVASLPLAACVVAPDGRVAAPDGGVAARVGPVAASTARRRPGASPAVVPAVPAAASTVPAAAPDIPAAAPASPSLPRLCPPLRRQSPPLRRQSPLLRPAIPATQRSSQGYTFSLGSGSVSWRSTRSSSVLGSSCEAEIYAGAMAAQELRWLTYLLADLGEPPRSPPVLYVDNKAMLALYREHRLEHRTKHIALRYFLARELQQRGQLRLAYVASEANTTDIFTKALPPGDHQRFCTMLGLVSTWPHLLTS
ncbi:unnamed protein product [Closterium sp. NIES-54]